MVRLLCRTESFGKTNLGNTLVNVDFRLIGGDESGNLFNHVSFLIHQNVTSLLNVPVLKWLES